MGQISNIVTKKKIEAIMLETRVPMTLRDHFLQDPFFSSSWSDMESVREHFAKQAQIMSQSFEDSWSKSERSVSENSDKQNNTTVAPSSNSSGLRSLLMPR